MDPVTHAASGALLNRLVAPRCCAAPRFSLRERTWLGAVAGLFPDVDWFLGLVIADSLVYYNLHRGETHSLLMLPLWAIVLGWVTARLWPEQRDWRDGAVIFALGIGIHIFGDWITNYGTQLLAPFSRETFAFPVTFILDPWVTGSLLLGLLLTWRYGGRLWAAVGLAAAGGVIAVQSVAKVHALEYARDEARERGMHGARVHAMAQPLSPLNWRLFIEGDDAYWSAHLGFRAQERPVDEDAGLLARHWQTFRPPHALEWEPLPRFGDGGWREFAEVAWWRPEFAEFRRFAALPYLRKVVDYEGDACAIFADLRFRIAQVPPPFQYASCRTPEGDWYRADVDYWERAVEELEPLLRERR
ncbi:MAG: metal-dependent hydrolase [Halorhodospira halophila]|uniref:metal-dependent hydrolase n=1 Tax=Halorhodospira TaxID=85108 RepID=UPI0019129353|nr:MULTISPECIES: metal-dependent hydrolase [Halorhodospira]MBK5942519.1 hypothetical protein [Halorhodospira halophila]MCC3750999.1 metal-dependent hydrolase [Halorhodospira halophila]MCG5534094.1 metal-dependent hydrolase [Halorhodospira sp. 9621]MCG5538283.1 metal-dependent hydrolase [Halorhodospira sp. 9622]